MKPWLTIIIVLCALPAFAQVDEISRASSNNSKSSGKHEGGGGSSGGSSFFFDFFFDGMAQWQGAKLQSDRSKFPSMVSLDLMFQGAVKPSSYYILWPRVRGNWGLLSTDFRMNYLIEEAAEGYKHIRTNDWQILQLNLITSKYLMFRVGSGIMSESFSDRRTFNETAFMFDVHAPDQTKVIAFEYRFAKDWNTGVNPRREFSIQYIQQIFSTGALHGYLSAGGVYQKYYGTIEVWGVQGGILFRIF